MNYFEEKVHQVESGELIAFGIKIHSRYGKAHEIIEMIEFARLAALYDVSSFVNEVFYDLKAALCSFELFNFFEESNDIEIGQKIFQAARKSISQFEWFSIVYNNNDDNLTSSLDFAQREFLRQFKFNGILQ